jgi:uncharacterized membrane protein YfcA
MYSNMAGLGGGGLMLPVSCIFFGQSLKEAIANTVGTAFTAGLIRYLFNLNQHHPTKVDFKGNPTGVLVDYNIGVIMFPMVVLGISFGSVLYVVLPDLMLLISLILIFICMIVSNSVNIYNIRKKQQVENERFKTSYSEHNTSEVAMYNSQLEDNYKKLACDSMQSYSDK